MRQIAYYKLWWPDCVYGILTNLHFHSHVYSSDHKLEYDNLDTMRLLYLRKCDAFGVVPCGNFLRHLDGKTMTLKNQYLGPNGIRAVVTPLPVS